MTVTAVVSDPEALTLTLTAELDQPVAAAWQLLADPRRLERWWGPPTWPATFVDHDLSPGARVTYFMTGPDGTRAWGWWRVVACTAPTHLEIEDGFGTDGGDPDPTMPVMVMHVDLADRAGGGTTLVLRTEFASTEAMARVLELGMEEGLTLAVGQMDAALAD